MKALDFIKHNWKGFALLGGGLLAIAILSTVILMLREERGFMVRECVKGEGITSTVTWAQHDLPVKVWLVDSEDRLEDDVKKGIEFWSPYLEWGGYQKPLQELIDPVIIVDSKPAGDEVHGTAKVKWIAGCTIKRVEVGIPMPMLEGRVRECVVAHELGHALGLDHDDDEDSVMAPTRDGRFRCEITKEDRALLVETYGK